MTLSIIRREIAVLKAKIKMQYHSMVFTTFNGQNTAAVIYRRFFTGKPLYVMLAKFYITIIKMTNNI